MPIYSTAEKQMTHDRIVVLLAANGAPPQAATLHSGGANCRFAPLSEDGPLYTLDSAIWSKARSALAELSYAFCPSAEEAQDFLGRYKRWDTCLVGLSSCEFCPLGRDDADLTLLPETSGWVFLGYDVVDAMGLSALTNVGFLPSKAVKVHQQIGAANQYGLIDDSHDAGMFAALASELAPEHAPFAAVVVKRWAP